MLRHRPSEIEEYRADLRSLCHEIGERKQPVAPVPLFRQQQAKRPAALFRRGRKIVTILYR